MNEPPVMESPLRASWQEANIFAAVSARDMALPAPNLLEELFLWFKSVRLYHVAEMGGALTDEDRHMQKQMLSSLISMGEWLVGSLRQHDVTAGAGVTLADVNATLEELYVSQRVSFGGMTEARRAKVLDEVFGAS